MDDDKNEIWDEFKWEEFMKEQDKKVDRYMELFYRYQDDPNRDEIIAREMGWNWLLEDKKGTDSTNPEIELPFVEHDDDLEEGEEWKANAPSDETSSMDMSDYHHLPVFQSAHEFALRALRFADEVPEGKKKDSSVVDFVSNAMIASAKIAGGTGLGNDLDELGGNIAYCKRGLAASNLAIAALYEMKEKGVIAWERYLELFEEATEVRNGIAVHILDLREKFRRGAP